MAKLTSCSSYAASTVTPAPELEGSRLLGRNFCPGSFAASGTHVAVATYAEWAKPARAPIAHFDDAMGSRRRHDPVRLDRMPGSKVR